MTDKITPDEHRAILAALRELVSVNTRLNVSTAASRPIHRVTLDPVCYGQVHRAVFESFSTRYSRSLTRLTKSDEFFYGFFYGGIWFDKGPGE